MLCVNNATRYVWQMILSCANEATARLAAGFNVPEFGAIEKVARRKLRQLDLAEHLVDLRTPPARKTSRR